MIKAILASVVLWPVVMALGLVLWVPGFFVCAYLAYRKDWVYKTSYMPHGRTIAVWRPRRAWLWSNDEDGVTGNPDWQQKYAESPRWGAFRWSAIRNPVNNMRFVPYLSVRIDPVKVGYVGNDLNPPKRLSLADQLPIGSIKWSFTWHGLYAGLVFRLQISKYRHFQIRLGWKLLPKDAYGIDDDDYRKQGCGLGTQLHPWREG